MTDIHQQEATVPARPQTATAPPAPRPEAPPHEAGTGIEVTGLDLHYGDFHAVKDVNVTLRRNKVTALIGSSGCGKSTFLRSINRMHELVPGATVDGSIRVEGEDIYAHGVDPVTVRRHIGMVFQAPNPFPTMSIYDNVAAGLKLNNRKMPKGDMDGIVEKSLRGAHLWDEVKDRLDKPGAGLSGGQQQRLCIARACAVEPQVLLMDEPASALDPIATLAVEDLIAELKKEFTIVIVTHNMQQAARSSDYTAFFNIERTGDPGELVEIGDTDMIFSNPTDKRTEDYTAFFNISKTGDPGELVEIGDTDVIFSNPTDKRTEDYVTGKFG